MRTRHSGFIILGMMLAAVSTAKGQDSTTVTVKNDQPCSAQVTIRQANRLVKQVRMEPHDVVTLRIAVVPGELLTAELWQRKCGNDQRYVTGPVPVNTESDLRITLFQHLALSQIAMVVRK